MRLNAPLTLIAALLLSGCYPFISGGRFDARVCELDEDGDGNLKCDHAGPDGATVPGDCNDDDPRMSSLNAEIPYDGVDNDCDGADLLDVDDDRFAGIARADYEALGGLAWPTGLNDGVDCNDEDGAINPDATEIFYDGVDQNCDEACDYDADDDGFADRRQGQGNDCGLPATDCNDTEPSIFPGATGEVFYDGEDQDCDQVNDFDPDGDGYAWAGYEAENDRFLERYGYTDTIVAFTECYDEDDSPLPESGPLDPANVSPARTEIFYNGVDDDCSDVSGPVVNDFDRDGDGFMPTARRAAFLNYVQRYVDYTKHDGARPLRDAFLAAYGADRAAWEAYFDARNNDCDDNDPAIRPGALERLGDSVDQDCDDNAHTTPFQFSRATFDGLGQHRVVATDTAFVVVASVTGDYDDGATAPGAQIAAVSFPIDATPDSAPIFENSPFPAAAGTVTPMVGAVGGTGRYWASLAWTTSTTTRTRTVAMRPATSGSSRYEVQTNRDGNSISTRTSHTQGELVEDTGTNRLWTVACDGTRVQYTETSRDASITRFTSNFENLDASDCFVLPSTSNGTLYVNTVRPTGSIRSFTVGSGGLLSEVGSGPFSGYSVFYATNHDDWSIFGMRPSGVRLYRNASTVRNVMSGRTTTDADAVFVGSIAYVAAIEPSGGGANLRLAYGNPTGAMTEVVVPFRRDGASLVPDAVAIDATADRVMIAVAGVDGSGNEQLGWAFFDI
jgi:hypothetical protein